MTRDSSVRWRRGHLTAEALAVDLLESCRDHCQQRVESSRLRSLSLRRARGNHTDYFWELLRVTVRVNAGAT